MLIIQLIFLLAIGFAIYAAIAGVRRFRDANPGAIALALLIIGVAFALDVF